VRSKPSHSGAVRRSAGGQRLGFIFTPDGYIITNSRRRRAPTERVVTDGRRLTANIVGDDPHTDLADHVEPPPAVGPVSDSDRVERSWADRLVPVLATPTSCASGTGRAIGPTASTAPMAGGERG
jgi:S1-C subfamily serine protease